ncbi:MAG: molybdopterin-dependent oxidoreductase [Actinomycetota bacterium]|nr:molybdopterin-dependent oxidoreductase [Actinomycetota bacterium]
MVKRLHITHWGAFEADTDGTTLSAVRPYAGDPDPHRIIENIAAAQQHPARIDRPYARAGWLDGGPGPTDSRGRDEFVPLDWDVALDLLAAELVRVRDNHGPSAIYGGSYGWASAGRFHHAQSQLKRFLSLAGGFASSVNNYSYGASQPFLPRVFVGEHVWESLATSWPVIAEHTELFVAFGGLPRKNTAVASGGNVRHDLVGWLRTIRGNGCRFVGVSPLRDDMPEEAEADWLAVRPGSDGALLQALAHTLIAEKRYDAAFVTSHCVGFEAFAASVADRTPEWAAERCGIPAATILALARDMATHRTMISMSWSMQRQPHGEQVVWLGLAVAALLGQIGSPGGGFGHGYASTNLVGHPPMLLNLPRFSAGHNPEKTFIPVARVADMLLDPGGEYDYNGQRLRYPDIRLVYWAGGNPFHHHQDLKRLRTAFGRPDTVVVHESMWTSTARHADLVLPATLSVERDDLGAGNAETELFPMPAMVAPYAQARDDYAILHGLAERMGFAEQFGAGRTPLEWLAHLYSGWVDTGARRGVTLPSFKEFWAAGEPLPVPASADTQVMLAGFRADPSGAPLRTPSGRIHLQSDEIEGFGYPDCPGIPTWFEPADWANADSYPLHLIANQPKTRLHSQLDVGGYSQSSKIAGREPVRINPVDAATRGIADGDVVRLRNAKGWCLAGAMLSEELAPGVVQLSTGAWYDPDEDGNCLHGNPNVLTTDVGTSLLGQGTTGQHAMVELEKFVGDLPPLTVLGPPRIRKTSS